MRKMVKALCALIPAFSFACASGHEGARTALDEAHAVLEELDSVQREACSILASIADDALVLQAFRPTEVAAARKLCGLLNSFKRPEPTESE